MKLTNIFKSSSDRLQRHEDLRGVIADVFYKSSIEHVAIIKSVAGAIRGNHYHQSTVQHMLITKGSLEYWYKDSPESEDVRMVVLSEGDLLTTPVREVHALKIGPDGNEFLVFTEGLRGGKDYESDTIRVPSIINPLGRGS